MEKTFIDYSKFNKLKYNIKNNDLYNEKDCLIEDLVKRSEELQLKIKLFKEYSFNLVKEYMQNTAKQYNSCFSTKGNLTITHTNKTYKVCKNIQEYIVLDEKLQIAKNLIDKCLNKWSEGGNIYLKKVINLAFSVDKRGKLNIPRVLSLRKLSIKDRDWDNAMQAIADSIATSNSREFIRIYKKNNKDEWKNISLDIAKL